MKRMNSGWNLKLKTAFKSASPLALTIDEARRLARLGTGGSYSIRESLMSWNQSSTKRLWRWSEVSKKQSKIGIEKQLINGTSVNGFSLQASFQRWFQSKSLARRTTTFCHWLSHLCFLTRRPICIIMFLLCYNDSIIFTINFVSLQSS